MLSVPASSAESERNFSVTGILTEKRRASLSSENINAMLFLNKNHMCSLLRMHISHQAKIHVTLVQTASAAKVPASCSSALLLPQLVVSDDEGLRWLLSGITECA